MQCMPRLFQPRTWELAAETGPGKSNNTIATPSRGNLCAFINSSGTQPVFQQASAKCQYKLIVKYNIVRTTDLSWHEKSPGFRHQVPIDLRAKQPWIYRASPTSSGGLVGPKFTLYSTLSNNT